jgi:periplasmic protein CpxP/Spy
MKLNFKNTLIATSIAAGLFGASAFAVAQNADGSGPRAEMRADCMTKGDSAGKHRADRMAKMEKHMAERQAKLKADLKLAPEQEAAWSAFVARTAPEPRMMGGKDGAKREDWSKLTTPERLDKMQARHAERAEHMAKRIEATKSLYASLTPEQQKTFDAQSMRGFQRAGMKGGKHHMGKHDHSHGLGEGAGMRMHQKGQSPAVDMPAKQS